MSELRAIGFLSIGDWFIQGERLSFSEIDEGRITGETLRLILNIDKEVDIDLKQLKSRDFEKMKAVLENHFLVT